MSVPLRTNRVLLAVAIDIVLTLVALYGASELRLALPFGKDLYGPYARLSAVVYLLTGIIWAGVFSQFNLYTRRWTRLRDEWWVLLFATLTALLILAGSLYMSFRQVSRLQFVYFGTIDLVLLSLARVVRAWWRVMLGERDRWRVLIAGAGAAGRSIAQNILLQRGTGIEVVGFLEDDVAQQEQPIVGLKVLGTLDDALVVIQRERVSEIVLALPQDAHERMLQVVMALEELPVQVSLVPDVLDLAWFVTRVDDLGGVPLLRLRESPLNGPLRAIKRLMDIVVAFLLLIPTLPIMLLAALLIKLDSPGPVMLRQKRIGENARPFGMLKLRSMYADAKEPAIEGSGEAARWLDDEQENRDDGDVAARIAVPPVKVTAAQLFKKYPNDPRITRVGRVLRHYSIDELPQLVNVLRGEMSLVGPRPELPWLVDCYEPWQRHRFAVPPGMTGWWQINGRSDRPMHLNVDDDLYYIRNYSLWLDIQILLRTVPAVLSGKGAY